MKPAIRSLRVQNLLSFGPDAPALELRNLNVLIGPNGSGKSNLIEVIGLLQSAPRDLAEPIRQGGGILEWLWKGTTQGPRRSVDTPTATIEAIVPSPVRQGPSPYVHKNIRYRVRISQVGHRPEIVDELVENELADRQLTDPYFYFKYQNGRPVVNVREVGRELRREDLDPHLSVLSQRKDPDSYPELTSLGVLFSGFRLYRDWAFGGRSTVRGVCSPDLKSDYLEEDASNLGLILNRLLAEPGVNKQLIDYLKLFYDSAEDLHAQVKQGVIETRLEEKHLKSTIPLRRLSDGTVRWLALLCILLDPEPPPLVCIEEPELGLHPDMIHEVGKLLLAASERTQLIVTTHSNLLLEEFNEHPDYVVVCEKENGSTKFERLTEADLSKWLQEFSLGQLWRQGQFGGNRW